jgi:hypothetical protein
MITEAALDEWIDASWPSHGNSPRPPWSRETFREMFEADQQRLAAARAANLQTREIETLQRENRALPALYS